MYNWNPSFMAYNLILYIHYIKYHILLYIHIIISLYMIPYILSCIIPLYTIHKGLLGNMTLNSGFH